jgi:conjugal transfer pilus assembly protein TraU
LSDIAKTAGIQAPVILLEVILLSFSVTQTDTTVSAIDPLCADDQLWSGELISDICWDCLFPNQVNGAALR